MYAEIKLVFIRPVVAKLVAVSVALLVVYQLVTGFVSYMSIKHAPITVSHSSLPTKAELNPPKHNAGLTADFFGHYVPKNLNELNVKRSMLNLKVVGIMLASDEDDSKVIIQTAHGNDQTYQVGDDVPGGATIKRITADGVLVYRNGELESLTLPKNDLIFEAPIKGL